MFGISWVALVLTLVSAGVVFAVSRLILRLNAKRWWALCDRIRELEGDLKHLRENPLEDFCRVEIKFRRGCDTDYSDLPKEEPACREAGPKEAASGTAS